MGAPRCQDAAAVKGKASRHPRPVTHRKMGLSLSHFDLQGGRGGEQQPGVKGAQDDRLVGSAGRAAGVYLLVQVRV